MIAPVPIGNKSSPLSPSPSYEKYEVEKKETFKYVLQGKKLKFGLGLSLTRKADKGVFEDGTGNTTVSEDHIPEKENITEVVKECNENQNNHDKVLKDLGSLGENLTTVIQKRQFLNRSVSNFANNLNTSLTGKKGSTRSTCEPAASAKLHTFAREFQEGLIKGKLLNIKTIEVGSEVFVAIKNGAEIRGTVRVLEDNFACVDFVDEEDEGNIIHPLYPTYFFSLSLFPSPLCMFSPLNISLLPFISFSSHLPSSPSLSTPSPLHPLSR